MDTIRILELLKSGEDVRCEFKECRSELSQDIYKSICSFLNRCGGDILLGVSEDGVITGIEPASVKNIQYSLTAALNNPLKINPPVYLVPELFEIDGRIVLHINVPESSRIHRCNGRVFDRIEDADIDISRQDDAMVSLFIRKQRTFTENTVYPFLTIAELRSDLIGRVRKLATICKENHLWSALDDDELLKSAGLYIQDFSTGKSGYTLAAALLFGCDDVIRSILPYYRTDVLLRRIDHDRYDDRDDIRTNLIDSYERLMTFIAKHLNDPFYLEGDVRISVRDKLFREIVSNLLIHRDYSNPVPARLIIGQDHVIAENGNKAHRFVNLTLENYSPYPKNPIVASMFREIGRADELGSGMRNAYRYCQIYAGTKPIFIEKDIFQTIILLRQANPKPLLLHDYPLLGESAGLATGARVWT